MGKEQAGGNTKCCKLNVYSTDSADTIVSLINRSGKQMSSDCQHKNYVYAASCSMIFDVSLRFAFAFASASLQLSLNCFLLLSLVRFGFTSPHSISIFIFISISISFGCRNSSCCHFVGSTFYDVFNYISERDMEEKEKTKKREGGGGTRPFAVAR